MYILMILKVETKIYKNSLRLSDLLSCFWGLLDFRLFAFCSKKEDKDQKEMASTPINTVGESYNFKVVLLGEGRVGKTSILIRYVEGTYQDQRPSTLSASFLEKRILLDSSSSITQKQKREVNLSIWDTAGQERFHSLGPIYYRDAQGAVVVYDITDLNSFDRVKQWTKELRKMVGEDICLVVVGNKSDLEPKRIVSSEEVIEYCDSIGALHLNTSAKANLNIQQIFLELAKSMIKKNPLQKSSTLSSFNNNINSNALLILDSSSLENSQNETQQGRCC